MSKNTPVSYTHLDVYKRQVQEGVQNIVDTLKEYEEVNEKFGDPEILEDPDKMDALINRQADVYKRQDLHRLNTSLEKSMIQIKFRKTMFLGLAGYSFQLSK